MKFIAALAAISIASSSAFSPSQSSPRSDTELYKYSPTKWTPQGGANPNFGAASSAASPATPVVETPASSFYSSLADSFTASSNTENKKNYSPTHWSPQGGATGGALWGADTASPVSTSYESLADSFAASSSNVEKKNYSPTHWSPQGGATGGTLWGADATSPTADSAPVAPVSSSYSSSADSSVASSSTESKKSYAPTHWSPQGGATGGALWGADAVAPAAGSESTAPVSSSYSAPADSFTVSSSTENKKGYAPTHWSPQGGATGGALWAAPASAAGSGPAVTVTSSYSTPADSLAASSSIDSKKGYAPTHWSPQGGATGGALWV